MPTYNTPGTASYTQAHKDCLKLFFTELAKTPEQEQLLKLFVAGQVMARPYAAPPGVPADRKEALVKAFAETMQDPAFLAEAKKLELEVAPVPPETIEKLLADLYETPKPVLQQAAALMGAQGT